MSLRTSESALTKFKLLIGTLAAWLFFLSDYLLDMRGMFDQQFYIPFKHLSQGVVLYATLVLFAFPFLSMGLSIILNRAHLKSLVPITWFYLLTVPVIIHTSFFYYNEIVKNLGVTGVGKVLLDRFDGFKNVMGAVYFAGLIIISLLLCIMISLGKSVFPRWFALINPIVGVIILQLLQWIIPNIAQHIYPLFIPATVLAIMMTVYSFYLWTHPKYLLTNIDDKQTQSTDR